MMNLVLAWDSRNARETVATLIDNSLRLLRSHDEPKQMKRGWQCESGKNREKGREGRKAKEVARAYVHGLVSQVRFFDHLLNK